MILDNLDKFAPTIADKFGSLLRGVELSISANDREKRKVKIG